MPDKLVHMRPSFSMRGILAAVLFSCCYPVRGAFLPSCTEGARSFLPCELVFNAQAGELPPSSSAYRSELLSVEFRSPRHTTYLIRAFSDDTKKFHIRFSPTEPGAWTYHVSSAIKRLDSNEGTFNTADSGIPGFVSVANVRHWWTTNKQPHLWLAAALPFFQLSGADLDGWLDSRRKDGFTHIRGVLLDSRAPIKPFTSNGEPNPAYFSMLDQAVLQAASKQFVLDLIWADHATLQAGAFAEHDRRDLLLRYLVARYGALNVTWNGFEQYEEVSDARALLRETCDELRQYDTFNHPRSTDARTSSSPLIRDGWMNFISEALANPALAAVEHQFTEAPQVHLVTGTKPDDFRHELWNATTNGEYPSISFEALQNQANVLAVKTWFKVMSDTRHWELEPYFDVDGARAIGLDEVEYLAYAQTPSIVEVSLPKHKYNPVWVNPASGEEIELKNYKGEVFSQTTPDNSHDWILQVPRDGRKASMLRSYRFESADPPLQEAELDPNKTPFSIVDPAGEELSGTIPAPFSIKLTKANRATRTMQYVWWGEVVAGAQGARLLGVGPSGTLNIPSVLAGQTGADLNLRLWAINANGKAYEADRVYRLKP